MEASSGDEEAMCWEEEGDGDGVGGSSTVEEKDVMKWEM